MNQKELTDFETSGVECPTCGKECASEHGVKIHHVRAHNESIRGTVVQCDQCGDKIRKADWELEANEKSFCGERCKNQHHSENFEPPNKLESKPTVECEVCGEVFERKPSEVKELNYCSPECVSEWQARNWVGEDHPSWKGGSGVYRTLRTTLTDESWQSKRKRVREQYGHTCQMCGKEESELERALDVHHIIPLLYGGTNDLYNLIPLCVECHITTERNTETILQDDYRIKERGGEADK